MSMPVTQDEFRAALSRFVSGITVVTTRDSTGIPHGITVSAFCSVSLEPPLILVCIENNAGSHPAFRDGAAFAVNVLNESQIDYSIRFASPSSDKFEGISFHDGLEGVPVFEEALLILECRLVNAHKGGDHTIFVGQVERATVNDGRPLVYFHGNYRSMN